MTASTLLKMPSPTNGIWVVTPPSIISPAFAEAASHEPAAYGRSVLLLTNTHTMQHSPGRAVDFDNALVVHTIAALSTACKEPG